MKPKTKRNIAIAAVVVLLSVVLWIVYKRLSDRLKLKQAIVNFNIDAGNIDEVYNEIYAVMKPVLESASPLEWITLESIESVAKTYFIGNPKKYYEMAAAKGDTSPSFVARCVVADTVRTKFANGHGGNISAENRSYLSSLDQGRQQ